MSTFSPAPAKRSLARPGYPSSEDRRRPSREPHADLKWGIWAYFLLLIFEGALRKWVLSGLATPLLIIRDPIALWLVVTAYSRGLLPLNGYVLGIGFIGIVGTIIAILFGHRNAPVAIYGGRILLIHFPLIFVIGRVFTRLDVVRMGKAMLWSATFMAILIGLQFYSPQSAWVNRGIGGDMAGGGFSGVMGYARPPGTFSFTNGVTMFFSLAACFIFYFWLDPGKLTSKERLLRLAATAALLIAIPLTISRGLFFQVLVTLFFSMGAIARRPKFMGRMVTATVGVLVAFVILSLTPAFQTAAEVMSTRFERAGESEGGIEGTLGNRFVGGLIRSLSGATDQPFLGYGLGLGTNVGAMFVGGGRGFLIAEGEWPRTIGELGPILGLLLIGIRFAFAIKVALDSYGGLVRGNLLPWILLSACFLWIVQGGWAQPTSLGFCVLAPGLLLASLRVPKRKRDSHRRGRALRGGLVEQGSKEAT